MNKQFQINDLCDPHIDLVKQTFKQIENDWGSSSVALKRWLSTYYPEILNNKDYCKKADINADVFLPYRNNGLWSGDDAISRLKLAIKAEVIIIFSNTELSEAEQFDIYVTVCLRLWTRIDSVKTRFSLEQFKNLLSNTYNYVIANWEETIEYLQEKQEKFKFKRKQTLYHYSVEDFDIVQSNMTLREAYKYWMEYTFPNLLDRYKIKKINEFKIEAITNGWSDEITQQKYNQFQADFALIKIKEPSVQAFRKLLERYNIQYKQKQH